MKQVLHFNKVIKFVIIFGDLCLLNIIFISLYHIFDYQTLGNEFTHSLSQLLVLLNLVYLLCNYSMASYCMNVLYVRNALYVGLSVIQLFTPRCSSAWLL